MAQSIRPQNKQIVDPKTGRLDLEWDAYFARLEQLLATTLTGGVTSFEGRTGVVTAADGDYNASEVVFTPAGNIAANRVSTALSELDTEKVATTRQVISGAGLTGGGDLSADRTLAVGAGTGITVNADSIETDDAAIVHDDLSGFVADEHVAHTGVTLTAGAGLTGGGDISASRSFAVGAGTGITVNADDVAITAGGVGTTQLADEGVTLAKLEHAGAYTLLMRDAGTTGDPAYAKLSSLTNSAGFGSGDKLMIEESTGELRKVDYDDLPGASGGSGPTVVAAQATTSGTAIDFGGLPSSVSRITVNFNEVSQSGNGDLLVQIGDSGGIEATGYESGSGDFAAANASTIGFHIRVQALARLVSGSMVLTKLDTNSWCASHAIGMRAVPNFTAGGGFKTLSAGPLDRVRVTLTTGNFDAGSVNIVYD